MRVLAGARDVLGPDERALDEQDARLQNLRGRVEDLLPAIAGVGEERDFLAARDRGSVAAQLRDLLAGPARELVEELVLHLREEIADRRHAVASGQNGQLEIVAERDAVAGH